MVKTTMAMSEKELREARDVRIPECIVGKLGQGIEPTEEEKNIIKQCGKVYVESHKKDDKWVKPHLRDLPDGGKSNPKGMKKVRHSRRKSRIELAEEILDFARGEAELGYSENDDKRIRDSAEKAYLSVVTATDYMMELHGLLPEPGPYAHKYRHKFLDEIGRGDLEEKYASFSDTLHGTCFYGGQCPANKKRMDVLFQEVEQYIEKIKEGI